MRKISTSPLSTTSNVPCARGDGFQLEGQADSSLRKILKYPVAPTVLPILDVLTGVEDTVKSLPAGMAEVARQKGSKDSTRQRETLTVTEKKALSNLRTNTDHAILLADKGGAKVVLETVDYNQKIGTLLQDPPHIRLAKGPTETVEHKTTLVRVLNKSTLAKKVCI